MSFSNSGDRNIKLLDGRQIGYMEELKPEHMGPEFINNLHMKRVFLGETDLGDEQSFILTKDKDESLVSSSGYLPALNI